MQNYIIHPNLATIFRSEVHYLMIFHKPETTTSAILTALSATSCAGYGPIAL